MARSKRSIDWGFPRWRGYEAGRAAEAVRLCDRVGCEARGDCPAPKSPNSTERWYFCQAHAAEYNKGWDYFAGLSAEEAAARAADEQRTNAGYRESAHHAWAGSGDGSRSRDEMNALDLLELEPDVDFATIKKAWRAKAKEVHPDVKPGDVAAAAEFHKLQLAYEVLRAAEDRRQWAGPAA